VLALQRSHRVGQPPARPNEYSRLTGTYGKDGLACRVRDRVRKAFIALGEIVSTSELVQRTFPRNSNFTPRTMRGCAARLAKLPQPSAGPRSTMVDRFQSTLCEINIETGSVHRAADAEESKTHQARQRPRPDAGMRGEEVSWASSSLIVFIARA
jgi:hypothetical protein